MESETEQRTYGNEFPADRRRPVAKVTAMSDEDSDGKLVTKFLLNTCRLLPPPSLHAVRALFRSALCADLRPNQDNEPETDSIPLATGSVAEFYIEPMLSCIGDVDVMFYRTTWLAIPEGHPPPTQLPTDFHSHVKLLEIIESEWPGYVYLELSYLMTECNDDNRFSSWQIGDKRAPVYLHNISSSNAKTHGPALLQERPSGSRKEGLYANTQDIVPCVRCLVWPAQAAAWPNRHRLSGLPDSATVDRVVSNGCDVVGIAHSECRQYAWYGTHQWRLSFSRAEVVLMNSWMPEQQIVYHILRMITKTICLMEGSHQPEVTVISKCHDNDTVRFIESPYISEEKMMSNYHVKTLMLWTYELKPRDWWFDRSNLLRTCANLLQILATRFDERLLQHYFIRNCNLFYEFDHCYCWMMAKNLVFFNESYLLKWFVPSYIQKCEPICQHKVSRLQADIRSIRTLGDLEDAVAALIDWRQQTWLGEQSAVNEGAVQAIARVIYSNRVNARSIRYWITELEKLDKPRYFIPNFIATAFLYGARQFSANEQRCYEVLDVLTTVCLYLNGRIEHHSRIRRNVNQSFKAATILLKLTANKPLCTLELIQIELCKAYLQKVLKWKNVTVYYHGDYPPVCLSNAYFAALHYARGQYETAADHCDLVLKASDHGQCCSHVVEGELLPRIDDDIDCVCGLTVLYQNLRASVLKEKHVKQQAQHVTVLTTNLFAHYLNVKCYIASNKRFMERLTKLDAIWEYLRFVTGLQNLFVTDALLLKQLLMGPVHWKIGKEKDQTSVMPLEELLLKSAVEHMTNFRRLASQYFESVRTIATTDFEALYAYRCGEYQQCFQLCRQNVRMFMASNSAVNVYTYPEFIQLMDDDIVSLVGLTLTIYPTCRDDDACGDAIEITQLTLSLYLLTECQLKLRRSISLLCDTLGYIQVAQRKHSPDRTLDHLTLRLVERKLLTFLGCRRL